jgi:hypothetical protein
MIAMPVALSLARLNEACFWRGSLPADLSRIAMLDFDRGFPGRFRVSDDDDDEGCGGSALAVRSSLLIFPGFSRDAGSRPSTGPFTMILMHLRIIA